VGVVLDSTVWIGAERRRFTVLQTLERVRLVVGDELAVIAAMTAAELVHGVWRAKPPQMRARREEFVEEIFARIPVQPLSLRVARIVGRIDARSRASGSVIPTVDLTIGATALDLGFAVATANVRHYNLIPGLRVVMVA